MITPIVQVDKTGLADYLKNNHPWKGGIIVSEKHQFLFMRAGKTGGTSVVHHFLKLEIEDLIIRDENIELHDKWLSKISDKQLEEYFVFSIVRNPFDRFISAAKYLGVEPDYLAKNFDRLCSVDKVFGHTLPLHFYTHNKGKCFTDAVVRMETLNEDMNLICDQLGLQRRVLPKTNFTDRGHYIDYYSNDLRVFVEDKYALDIKYYGYVFDLSKKIFPKKGSLVKRVFSKLSGR